jgi:hypothetical protein
MNTKYIDSNGDYHWLLQGEPMEDWTEVVEDENQLPDLNYQIPYDAQRMNSYPTIGNQLDMLWHELNQSGSLTTNGEWFNQIKSVKDTFPKP